MHDRPRDREMMRTLTALSSVDTRLTLANKKTRVCTIKREKTNIKYIFQYYILLFYCCSVIRVSEIQLLTSSRVEIEASLKVVFTISEVRDNTERMSLQGR